VHHKLAEILQKEVPLVLRNLWPDDLSFKDVSPKGILRHRQVTEEYLVALAVSRKGRIATMNEGLSALHPAQSTLIPQ
jgi:hypothetical protein